jgi:zeaxanthin glucosyltransferase
MTALARQLQARNHDTDCNWCFPWGDQVDPEQIGPAPTNAIIVKQAPQLELLKQASVCITHAGLNTVLESLAQRCPASSYPGSL